MKYIPIVVAIIGVAIHAFGLFNLIPHPFFIADLSMLIIDLCVVYSLMEKLRWGYYLALLLFLQQSIMQPYWAYQKYITHFFIVHPMEYLVAPLLVILSLFILVFNRKLFIDR